MVWRLVERRYSLSKAIARRGVGGWRGMEDWHGKPTQPKHFRIVQRLASLAVGVDLFRSLSGLRTMGYSARRRCLLAAMPSYVGARVVELSIST